MHIGKRTWPLVFVAAFAATSLAQAKVIEDQSGSLKTLTTIGDALEAPDQHPVHILYVHGIDQIGAGDSSLLRQSICTKLNLCDLSEWKNASVEFADEGEFAAGLPPPALEYLGSPVWNNADEWHAAAPFVVHWMVRLRGHRAPLVVDEINWWPLVLALKCRRVMAPEAYLAGPDRNLLNLCSEPSAQDPGGIGRFYPWIAADEAAKLARIRPRGALINRTLKDSLVDWGLADVMLATGQIGGLLRDGIRQLMAKSAAFDAGMASTSVAEGAALGKYDWKTQLSHDNALDQEFIGVTHSLGGYLFFNTLSLGDAAAPPANQSREDAQRMAREEDAARYIFERTSLVYFLANQLEMLEFTNLENAPASTSPLQSRGLMPPPISTNPAVNFKSLVNRWQQKQAGFQASLHPADDSARKKIQVVAFSDPSDVLTWRVPRIGNVDVVNLYVQNAPHWFWFFESPSKAHGNYAKNKAVLKVMFGDIAHRMPAR